jgi:hypothetical protein
MSKYADLIGKTFEVECPFVHSVYTEFDEDGSHTTLTWKPGIEWVMVGPEGEADARAHGMGLVRYHVVSVHELPRPFPARVFFTRRWVAPDGREFGRNKLFIMTVEAFRRRLAGYKPGGFDRWTKMEVEPLSPEERAELVAA